jgi:exodeoxyribonuclease VII small subunit
LPGRSFLHHASLTPVAPLPHSDAMDTPTEDLSFEEALKELEKIVAQLESGDTPLQHAIELYERGNKLRQRCADRLDAAQARIEAIRLDGEGNPAGVRPFVAG